MAHVKKYVTAFGRFWWDFLIGENPDAFICTVVVIAVALLLRHERALALTLVPLLTVAFLVVSAYRGRQRA
jgi:hypothetical protein